VPTPRVSSPGPTPDRRRSQRAPELLLAVEEIRGSGSTTGRFLLSGSANLSLLNGNHRLARRKGRPFHAPALSVRELRESTEEPPFLPRFFAEQTVPRKAVEPLAPAQVLAGGLPPVALGRSASVAVATRNSCRRYLERDVRDLAQVADLPPSAGSSSWPPCAPARLECERAGSRCAAKRLYRWPLAGILEASFAVVRVPPFLGNRRAA